MLLRHGYGVVLDESPVFDSARFHEDVFCGGRGGDAEEAVQHGSAELYAVQLASVGTVFACRTEAVGSEEC